MENALLVGLSRQIALTHDLDIVANNIANIDTTGYKADNALFSQYLMPKASDGDFAGTDRRIDFVTDRASWIDFSEGAIQRTGNPLDVAIKGNGYLVVQTPRGVRYTRNGALITNAAGQLVTDEGYPVLGENGPITFQNTDHNINISPSGIITVREGNEHDRIPARQAAAGGIQSAEPAAERQRQHVCRRRPASIPARRLQHRCGARRNREIERQCRRRDFAHDPNNPVVYRHRQRSGATERPAQKRADHSLPGAGFGQRISGTAGQV